MGVFTLLRKELQQQLSGPTKIGWNYIAYDKLLDINDYQNISPLSIPNIWAPALVFSEVLRSKQIQKEPPVFSEIRKDTEYLFINYLFGVFIQMFTIEEKDFDNRKPLDKVIKDSYYTLKLNFNDLPNLDKLYLLKYKQDVIAIFYPECLFFPAAEYSFWWQLPRPEGSKEYQMLSELDQWKNNKLYFKHFLGFLKYIYDNQKYIVHVNRNTPWTIGINKFLNVIQEENPSINLNEMKQKFQNLLQANKIKLYKKLPINYQVEFEFYSL